MTQKSELRLVPMTAALVKEVALLEQICFTDPWSQSALRAELEEPTSAWLVALEDKRPVGYIGLRVMRDEGEIVNLAVSPGRRKTGVASALLSTVLDFAAFQGVTYIWLEVRESNTAARKLYQKFGFEQVGLREKYYTAPVENAVLMKKELELC
jgi:ribosomal-protein-alanine N-acetyltransferase